MAKNKKRRFPKRVAGVKVPKRFRQFADSPVGGNLVAMGLAYGAYSLATSEGARSLVTRMREELERVDHALHSFSGERRARAFADEDYSQPPN